ncbi:MAG: aspartate-semialdehyde dehydrogenase [Candidatus Fonsibacter ubiquis]|nr:aspartate-semialdehyde dehydrogenase [Candidatus Fonsibacter ubiquis]
MKINIAIVGSTGNVGRKTVEALERRKFVIEHSKHFRMLKDIPLVIPEVNEYALKNYKKKNIISNPNCSTTQLVLALKPLHDKFKVTRVVTSTYQSVSGAGKASMDELISQTKDYLAKKKIKPVKFTKQIAFNVIPHIDVFMKDGSTKEEWKMENETKKILDKNIKVTATCVRVPVLISHSESVNIELKKRFNIKQIKSILSKAAGCKVIDEHKNGGYATPAECAGSFLTYISRIRKDPTKNAINLWIVSDNLLKGAAFNGVQIAEVLVKKYIKNN